MNYTVRRKWFAAAIVTLNVVAVFWFLLNLLEGSSLGMSIFNLLWHLLLLNVVMALLWRGGGISRKPSA
jgi:hypothetical protein